MKLSIISQFKNETHEINWIELNTSKGNFVIQGEHAPMILTLSPGKKITFELTQSKKTTSISIECAIAHITRDSATIIVNK